VLLRVDDLFILCFLIEKQTGESSGCSLWRVPEVSLDSSMDLSHAIPSSPLTSLPVASRRVSWFVPSSITITIIYCSYYYSYYYTSTPSSLLLNQLKIYSAIWSPHQNTRVLTVEDRGLSLSEIDSSSTLAKETTKLWFNGREFLSKGAWDPHHPHVVVTTAGNAIQIWDLRTSK
jgi:hypothetical protein